MNKRMLPSVVALLIFLVLGMARPVRAQMGKAAANSSGEQFFVISSVDMQKQQIVLMYPTQLTIVGTTTDKTIYVGENGEKMALKDLRAGQTIWATLRKEKGGQETVVKVRQGAMSVAELHKLYLDYPAK